MSEMFTKIGGYIASGDAMVYADSATMTGDGTVASPFGVNKTDMFVQSPLFTGTSGEGSATSAYIGIQPSAQYNETVLWETTAGMAPAGTAKIGTLSEPLSSFNSYAICVSFESMYPYKRNVFEVPTTWNTAANVPGVYFLGVTETYSLKPQEHNELFESYNTFGIGENLTDLYSLGAKIVDNGVINDSITGLSYCWKVIGINRKPEA